MQQIAPEKQLIEAPTSGQGATCKSCAHCPWMAMNTLDKVEQAIGLGQGKITVPGVIAQQARVALGRMVAF